MAEFQQRGDELENNYAECKRLLEEAQEHLKELEKGDEGEEDEERKSELKKIQDEFRKLKEDEKLFEKLIGEHRQEEKKLPWNVDTLSKEGFSKVRHRIEVTRLVKYSVISVLCSLSSFFQSVLNTKPVTNEETVEGTLEKHKTFVEKYAKEIRHFGMLISV